MAQLKDSVVQGSLRVTDTTYTTDLVVSDVTAHTIVNNDYLLVADASDGNKLLKGPVFDGSTTNKALTKKGTWETFGTSNVTVGTGASNAAAGNHVHGNLTNDGKITATATIANGDKIVIVDSDSTAASKITGSSITFDGSTATKALTQKGTWETFNNYSHPTGDGNLHVPATGTGNNGKFLKAGSTAGSLSWDTAVTSVQVQATSPLTSSTNTAQTSTLNTTIAFSNQNANLILAGPSSGNAAAPTFRSLVAADLPIATTSAIGGVSASTGLSVAATGALSVSYGTTANTALQGNQVLFKLNNTDKKASDAASFYAPTTGGTSGYLLESKGTAAPEWIQATDSNVASTIVKRNSSGNFSANIISSTLNGIIAYESTLTKGQAPTGDVLRFTYCSAYESGTGRAAANRIGGLVEGLIDTNGRAGLVLRAYQHTANSTVDNNLVLYCDTSGTATYSVSNPANFCKAIGAPQIKVVKFTSKTINSSGYTYDDNWITVDTAVVATDLQLQSPPGIVEWTITAGHIKFTCATSTTLTFTIMMLKECK